MYNEKDMEDLVELLYPYFIKKYKEDQSFKQTPQIIGAKFLGYKNFSYESETTENEDGSVNVTMATTSGTKVAIVRLADETNTKNTFNVPIITTESLNEGDYVYLMYWNDLKNAKLFMKG